MADAKKSYKAARPVIISGKTYFTGQTVSLDEETAKPLVASGQVYLPDPKPSAEDLDAVAAEKKAAEATTTQTEPAEKPEAKATEPAKG